MLALSDGAWGVVGILIAQLGGIVVLLIKLARTSEQVRQVNRAVNHVKPGEPTLIQRVTDLEQQQARHRDWTHQSMCAIAHQLGVRLTPIDQPEENQ